MLLAAAGKRRRHGAERAGLRADALGLG